MNAETLMLVGGVAVFSLTIYWVRSRDLSEKHAILWTILAFILLVCGLFPNLIMSFANKSHLSYSAAVLFVALAAIYIFFLLSFCLPHMASATEHSLDAGDCIARKSG